MPSLSTLNTTSPTHPRILSLTDASLLRKKVQTRAQKAKLLARLHAISIRQFRGELPLLLPGRRKVEEYVPAHLKAARVVERVVGAWRSLRGKVDGRTGKSKGEVVETVMGEGEREDEVCVRKVLVGERLNARGSSSSFSPLPELPSLPSLPRTTTTPKARVPKITFAPLPNPLAPTQKSRPQFLSPHTPLLPILKKPSAHPGSLPSPPQITWEEIRKALPRPRPYLYLAPLAKEQKDILEEGITACPVSLDGVDFVGEEGEGAGGNFGLGEFGLGEAPPFVFDPQEQQPWLGAAFQNEGGAIPQYQQMDGAAMGEVDPMLWLNMDGIPQVLDDNMWAGFQEEQNQNQPPAASPQQLPSPPEQGHAAPYHMQAQPAAFPPPQQLPSPPERGYVVPYPMPAWHPGADLPILDEHGVFIPFDHSTETEEQKAMIPRWKPWMAPGYQHDAPPALVPAPAHFQGLAHFAPPPDVQYGQYGQMGNGPPPVQFQGGHMNQMQMMGGQFLPLQHSEFGNPVNNAGGPFQPQYGQEGQAQMGFQQQGPYPPPGLPLGQDPVAPNPPVVYGFPQDLGPLQLPFGNDHPQVLGNAQDAQVAEAPVPLPSLPSPSEAPEVASPAVVSQPSRPEIARPRFRVDRESRQSQTPAPRSPQTPYSRPAPLAVPRLVTRGPTARERASRRDMVAATRTTEVTSRETVSHRDGVDAAPAAEAPELQQEPDAFMNDFVNFDPLPLDEDAAQYPTPVEGSTGYSGEQSEAANVEQEASPPEMQQFHDFQGRGEAVELNGGDSPGETDPPRPAGRPDSLHGTFMYMLVSDNTSVKVKPKDPEEPKNLNRWFFIPDELAELYAGDKWPDLYSYLALKPCCDGTEILPVFEKQIREHFPLLLKPYKGAESSKLVQFLRYMLNHLPYSEWVEYAIPYQNFGEILKAYREEWEDWTNRPRKTRGAPHHKFEEIFLAFIILSNPHYRQIYDNDRDAKDPCNDHNMVFDLSHEPNYQINLIQEVHGLEIEKGIANVGVWISKEHKDSLDTVRNDALGRLVLERNAIDSSTEDLEWKHHNGNDFHLMQKQQRKCRTGWWAEIEKLADLSLKCGANMLHRL